MDTQEKTAWERERDLLMMLLQDREHQRQDVRQERDAWQPQAERLTPNAYLFSSSISIFTAVSSC